MEAFFTQLFTALSFFATGPGVFAIGATATLLFLLWEWRFALIGLLLIQLGVGVLVVRIQGMPAQAVGIQLLVMGLCTLLLSLSAAQQRSPLALQPPGSWLLRLMAVVLLLVSWRLFDLNLPIPLLTAGLASLCVWLALCALVLLSLSDTPLFTAVALLLWCIPMQVVVETMAPGHSLFVLIGIVEIVLALACSYLVLVDLTPVAQPIPIPTDNSFLEPSPPLALPTPAVRGLLPSASSASTPHWPTEPAPEAPFAARGSQ